MAAMPARTDLPIIGRTGPGYGRTCSSPQTPTDVPGGHDGGLNLEPYFLTGSVRLRRCPEVEPILVRLREYRDIELDIAVTEVEGGDLELSIDGCRELNLHGVLRLEEQLQALGSYAREAAIFQRHHELDVCDLIVAPSREAGLVALSRRRLEECRLSIEAMIPADRASLIEELRAGLEANEPS
jgi:hypothetical protein